jgi:hypothetical protein
MKKGCLILVFLCFQISAQTSFEKGQRMMEPFIPKIGTKLLLVAKN